MVPRRPTQAERRAQTRDALLESAARGLSRHGYGNLRLEQVAKDAGYTRGALYHLFDDKQDLTLATIDWVLEAWEREVGPVVDQETDPVAALLTLASGHAVFCRRRDIARMAVGLRLEFAGQDHLVGRAIERAYEELASDCVGLIKAGRKTGAIPPGPPARALALGFIGALEGAVIQLAGEAPHDERLAVRAVSGVLGIDKLQ